MYSIKANEDVGLELLYRGKSLHDVPFENTEHYNQYCELLDLPKLSSEENWSKDFNIPARYKTLEVDEYIRALAPQDEQSIARVEMELELFRTRNLFPILQTLIYIADTMRNNNIVSGVGRGSSVASYCLYLIGIHRINSLKYNLDISEFLK